MDRSRKIKFGLFLTFVILLVVLKQFTPVGEMMTVENLRLWIEPLGYWGVIIFIIAFILGTIFQIPGVLFYSAAFLIFGNVMGGFIAYIGSVLAVIGSFYFARHMGGSALDQIKHPKIKTILQKLEQKPVLIIGLLRTFMWVSPPLNYALAFSKIPSRKYIIGSVLGLMVPAAIFAGGSCFF
ncbi:MAG: TVP38/TMEM64 family protein [Bacteroidetes bacterium]|nr:TVP38/TMEM64 family protein [Bacteroidota bacterium]